MEQKLHQALSISVEALTDMAAGKFDSAADRVELLHRTIAAVRCQVGEALRITTMHVTCAWCQDHIGTQEGNGSTGESHGMCISCRDKILKEEGIHEHTEL